MCVCRCAPPPRIDIFEARKCQFWLLCCSGAASYISEWVGGADMKRYVNGNIWRRDPDHRIKQMIKRCRLFLIFQNICVQQIAVSLKRQIVIQNLLIKTYYVGRVPMKELPKRIVLPPPTPPKKAQGAGLNSPTI